MAKNPVRESTGPVALKVLGLITDEWQPYQDVVKKGSRFVPGEVAMRTAERLRGYHFKSLGREIQPRRFEDPTNIILSGSRAYVGHMLADFKRRGRIEVEYEEREVRRKPVRVKLSESEIALRKAE